MSKRKREEDTPGYETFPLIPSVTPSQDPKCENDAVNQIAKLAFLRARYSDMKLICGDEVFYAHKPIVCPQSDYFGRACSSGFKEAAEPFQFPDKEPGQMRKILEYLYTGTYTLNFELSTVHSKGHLPSQGGSAKGQSNVVLPSESSAGPSKPRLYVQTSSTTASTSEEGSGYDFEASCIANQSYFHVCMFAEADYFQVDGLKQTSKRFFRRSFASSQNKTLKKEIIQETLEELYSNRCDYQQLKEIAIARRVQLLRFPDTKNDSLLSPKITQDFPDFAHDLCTALIELADQPISVPKTPKGGAKPAIERSS
ncbi:hypothetical protein PEBR_24099 [Penicillium brasilianum]|uniref:BTB domain-containing protein n=1 Tax=Penicillium brasilianum TaxID=104259 RepID=A0A1S9RKG5_PENBI|nr:hypothetical protein PEBR_24099 [Penicillium brasilianum]